MLRNSDAVRTFGGNAHLSVGAGVSAAAGVVGRAAEADFRAGDGGYAACYTYSCSKGNLNTYFHMNNCDHKQLKFIVNIKWNIDRGGDFNPFTYKRL